MRVYSPPSPSLQPYCVTLMSHEREEEDDEPRLNVATLHADVASTITDMVSMSIKFSHSTSLSENSLFQPCKFKKKRAQGDIIHKSALGGGEGVAQKQTLVLIYCVSFTVKSLKILRISFVNGNLIHT